MAAKGPVSVVDRESRKNQLLTAESSFSVALRSKKKPRHAAACARCGKAGRPRQLNELLLFDRDEPVIALCGKCVHLLRCADAKTWKGFREYRDRLTQGE